MSFKYTLPSSTKIPARTLKHELAKIRQLVMSSIREGAHGLLARAYRAIGELATSPVKPRFAFKPMKSRPILVDTDDSALIMHYLRHMAGFTPQPGAGVQNRFAGTRVKQQRDQLGRFVLHLETAIAEGGHGRKRGYRSMDMDAVGSESRR